MESHGRMESRSRAVMESRGLDYATTRLHDGSPTDIRQPYS